ncbi:hypothetical protein Tco_0109551 [Tanacetum coccineum]
MIDTPYPMEVERHINQLNEHAVLDRKLDTPYPIEVDTPYLAIDQNSSIRYGVSNGFDTAYREFLGVGTTFDIFQHRIPPVSSLTGYGSFVPTLLSFSKMSLPRPMVSLESFKTSFMKVHINTPTFRNYNLQISHRDDHRKGLRSIGKALKDMMSGKRK